MESGLEIITRIQDILSNSTQTHGDSVFEDSWFRRRHIKSSSEEFVDLDILIDSLITENVHLLSVSVQFTGKSCIAFNFESAQKTDDTNGFYIELENGDGFWIPRLPQKRAYDALGHVVDEDIVQWELRRNNGQVELLIEGDSDDRIEFSVLFFSKDSNITIHDILNPTDIERKTVRSYHFYYTAGHTQFWDCYINGRIYEKRFTAYKKYRWFCEQCSFQFYNHLRYLYLQTGKCLYHCLCEIIAYSILVAYRRQLPGHGLWTDLNEIHFRFRLDGVELLLRFFQQNKRPVFWETAVTAVSSVLSFGDSLNNNGVWFLHDSLEAKEEYRKKHYREGFVNSRFLGKSKSNTLCLNTHIQTLNILHLFRRIDAKDEYANYLHRGTDSLLSALDTQNGELGYRLIYQTRDFLQQKLMRQKNRIIRKCYHRYMLLLRKYILPVIKKFFPRLYMPDGFIERDLCAGGVNEFYHFFTLRDLVILYSQSRDPKLYPLIEKSIRYTCESQYLQFYFKEIDHRANIMIETLWLFFLVSQDKSILSYLKECLSLLTQEGINLTADIFSNSFFAEPVFIVKTGNPQVVVFTNPTDGPLKACLFNPTSDDQTLNLEIPEKSEIHLCRSADKDVLSQGGQIVLPAGNHFEIYMKRF